MVSEGAACAPALVKCMENASMLAIAMATSQQRFGDWREVFRRVDRIDKVTKEDIQRVARAVFVESNRTAVWIESTAQGGK